MLFLGPNEKMLCRRWLIGFLGIFLLTFALLALPLGDGLAKLSYDLPFLFRGHISDTNVVVLVEDRATLDALGHAAFPPERTVHAQLVDRLREEGVELVVFDISFRAAKSDEDKLFAEAIRRHGRVILGGVVETTMQQLGDSAGVRIAETKPPTDLLRSAAAGWGVLAMGDPDSNLVVRKILTQWRSHPAVPWLAAQFSGKIPIEEDPNNERWINYYGASPALDQITLGEVLGVGGRDMPPGYLRGKVVFVGFDSAVTPASGRRDVFATPFSRFRHDFTPGVEILANIYANLINRDWLERVPLPMQFLSALVFGAVSFLALVYARRRWVWLIALALMLLVVVFSFLLQWNSHRWWNWLAPALVQLPLTVVLTLFYPHQPVVAFISYRRKGGDAFAMALLSQMRARGKDVLIDVNEITGGEFPDQIYKMIDRVPNVILVLSPDALDDRISNPEDWLRKETTYAFSKNKTIIPVFLEGFKESDMQLPACMEGLKILQGVHHRHNEWNTTLTRIESYLKHYSILSTRRVR